MIIDTLDQRHRLPADASLRTALEVLAGLDATAAPGTRVDLGDDRGHVSVADFTSLDPQEQVRFEAHRAFADVHVVLSGRERIEVAALDALRPLTEFDENNDIGFHTGSGTVALTLEPGWFVVCYPTDAHRPGLWVDGPERVLKAVGKVRVA